VKWPIVIRIDGSDFCRANECLRQPRLVSGDSDALRIWGNVMIDDDDAATWAQDEATELRNAINRHPLKKDAGYRRLIEAVATEVRKTQPGEQYWRLDKGIAVVEMIMRAVNEDGWKLLDEDQAGAKKTYWYHQGRVRLAGKKRLTPYITVNETQEAVATYLDLPYRVPALDRILVDMLMASEMFAFADEVQPILNKKLPLLLGWLLNNILSVLIGGGIAALCFWIGDGGTVLNWVGGIILALTLLGTAWSLIAYPFYYPKVRAHHKKVEGAISAMLDAYAAIAGSPASTKHIGEMLAKATDKGAVWPSQLMVLMEDVTARSATF